MINKDTYKRFTELKTYNNGKKMYVQYSVSGCYNDMNRKGDYTTGDSVDRLAELEDKIENGTLEEIPENAVVLTKEECEHKVILDEDHFERALNYEREKTRKETAKEFAEKLKKYLYNSYNLYEDISYEEFCKANVIFGDIDKLLEEYEVEE